MEAEQMAVDSFGVITGMSSSSANPATLPSQLEHSVGVRVDSPQVLSAKKKKKLKTNNQVSQENNAPPSVSSCYVFKSRLQEYAQKAGLTTPVYETTKEGPSHEPCFKSTVILNNVRYDSLPGFFNRKAAEQSAAEVALIKLSNSVDTKFGISAPVHETGLCKNLLQEYAQKMNYAMPLYECHKEEKQGRMSMYSCTVEIGGIKYIGTSASTKKEAEIKAARTALLAIQSAAKVADDLTNNSVYTVIPHKKKGSDLRISTQETSAALKPKKGRFKKQQRKKWRALKKGVQGTMSSRSAVTMDGRVDVELGRGLEVNMEGRVGVEFVHGSEVNMEGRDGVELGGGSQVIMGGLAGLESGGVSDLNMAGQVGVEPGGGLEVDMDGRVGIELGVCEAVGSQHNGTDDLKVTTVGGATSELTATSAATFQGADSGVGRVENATETSSSGVCNGAPENAPVPFEAAPCKDGESLTTDAHP